MGGFFLCDKKANINLNIARSHFEKIGFSCPETFSFSEFELLIYQKISVKIQNWFIDDADNFIGVVGSLTYKGFSYSKSIEMLLQDYIYANVAWKEIIGSYCAIVVINKKVHIINDPFSNYHVFGDYEGYCLSSSFLALIQAMNKKVTINHMACLENLTTGYIIGPDTLANEIYVLNTISQKKLKSKLFEFVHVPIDRKIVNYTGKSACLNNQINALENHIGKTSAIAEMYGADCGISGGYDSRLLFGLLKKTLPFSPSLHTHSVKGHHDKSSDKAIGQLIGATYNIPVKYIESLSAKDMSEAEILGNLSESILYYDGRCNEVMGNYQTTCTSSYRIKILGDIGAGYNGLAGELYRNFCHISRNKMKFENWAQFNLFYPGFLRTFFNLPIYWELIEYIKKKIQDLLEPDLFDNISSFSIRRFLGEIKIPYNYGVRINAENQLAFFFTPFCDWQIVMNSYNAIPHIGKTGKFEADMIESTDKNLGGIDSSYGFPLNNEPFRYKMEKAIRAHSPIFIAKLKNNRKAILYQRYLAYYKNMTDKSSVLYDDLLTVTRLFPYVNWKRLMYNSNQFDCSVFLGHVLNEYFL